jgi:hypothetical protein
VDDQTPYDVDAHEMQEYVVGMFRAFMESKKFREILNDHFVVRHWVVDDKLIRIEVIEKDLRPKYLN